MRGIMTIGRFILSSVLLLGSLGAGPAVDETELPPTYLPTGKQMYTQYCAACHGADGKGHGPLAPVLKTSPADLSTLAKRHQGKFPYEYVASVLEFGPGFTAHGSSDMPTWGPIFRYYDKRNERVVKQRIQNLSDYVASLQVNR
jgi:mono/diheme cytochrome c family protein